MRLSQDAEEIAVLYSFVKMIEYSSKDYDENFLMDWRRTMTNDEREIITDLKKCNFRPMYEYLAKELEEYKAMSMEEKEVSFLSDFIF